MVEADDGPQALRGAHVVPPADPEAEEVEADREQHQRPEPAQAVEGGEWHERSPCTGQAER